eukprot:sb/3468494/
MSLHLSKPGTDRPISTHYVGHVTGYQPIRDRYLLIRNPQVTTTTPVSDSSIANNNTTVSSTESSVSLEIVEEDEGERKEEGIPARGSGGDVKDNKFDSIQNLVYSEVATLISVNESRPHYLVEVVRELIGLENDYLRQRHLIMLKDLKSSYLVEGAAVKTRTATSAWASNIGVFSASEATPSNNSLVSADNVRLSWDYDSKHQDVDNEEFDYLENVENLSSVSTNNSHPFASESLGSTAINLSSDLADVRRREEMESK